jgi:hypothetical protein
LLEARQAAPADPDRGLIVRNIPSGTQGISAASLPLPTGASTEATLATLLTLAGFQARINTQGQKTMATSTPVVLASDQASIPVAATLDAETTKVIGTVNQGTSPWVISGSISATSAATVSVAAPAYVEGTSSALSQTPQGELRATDRQLGDIIDLLKIQISLLRVLTLQHAEMSGSNIDPLSFMEPYQLQ